MKNLYHASDHFPDLVVKEGLAFKVEADEFNRIRVVCRRALEGLCVDVAELGRVHVDHEPLGGHLMGFDLFRVVVVLMGTNKTAPTLL